MKARCEPRRRPSPPKECHLLRPWCGDEHIDHRRPGDIHLTPTRTAATESGVSDFATENPSASMTSPLGQSMGQQGFGGQFHKDFEPAARPNSAVSGTQGADINCSASSASTAVAHGQGIPSRNDTLNKKSSMRCSIGAEANLILLICERTLGIHR